MATINEVFTSDALLWLEFGGQYVNFAGKTVIDNLAERGDAPSTVQCGDGTTSTTFPTQLSGRRGVSFDGGDYIDCGLVDRFERTDAFTLVVVSSVNCPVAGYSLLASTDAGANERGIEMGVSSIGQRTAYLISTWAPSNRIGIATAAGVYGTRLQALSYSGTSTAAGARLSAGESLGTATADTLSTTIKSGKAFLLGAKHNGAGKTSFYTGTMHFAAIFPFAASPLQIANLHKRVLRRINLP